MAHRATLDSTPKRRWGGVAALALLAATPAATRAAAIEFIVDRGDGSLYVKNTSVATETFDGYSIVSAGGGLLVGGWASVADNYDADGDQSVDSTANWFAFPAPSTTNLAEVSPVAGSGSLAAGQIVALGAAFNLGSAEDLVVTTSANGGASGPFAALFRTLTADYDADLDVDADDYGVFAATYGSTVDLRADGNNDGVVNAADYTVWRDSDALAPAVALLTDAAFSGANLGSAIPEPTGAALLAAAAALSSTRRRAAR